MNLEKGEEAVEVKGYEEHYSATSLGRVYSRISNKFLSTKGITTKGYRTITLHKNGKQSPVLVHRVIAMAFCEGQKEGLQVNHIDGDKLNNNSRNLEWVTPSENQYHMHKIGLFKLTDKGRKAHSKWAKKMGTAMKGHKFAFRFDVDAMSEIVECKLNTDITYRELVELTGFSKNTIGKYVREAS